MSLKASWNKESYLTPRYIVCSIELTSIYILRDMQSYVMSLKAQSHQHSMGMARPIFPGSSGGLGHSGSSPADYLMYLMRTHTAEQHNCLPVMDLIGYGCSYNKRSICLDIC